MGRKKKEENEIKTRRYLVVDPDCDDDLGEDCSCCPCLRLVSIDLIPDEYLDLFHDLGLIKIRLGYNRENSELFMSPVIYLCEEKDDEFSEEDDYTKIKVGTAEILVEKKDDE